MPGTLLLFWLLAVLLLRTSRVGAKGQKSVVECLYIRAEVRGKGRNHFVLHRCLVPHQDAFWDDLVYDLPSTVVNALDLENVHSGEYWLTLGGAHLEHQPDGDTIVWDGKGRIKKSRAEPSDKRGAHRRTKARKRRRTTRASVVTGTRTVLVVRVLSRDGLEPSFDRSRLEHNYFNTTPGVTTFVNQYALCSNGALAMKPARVSPTYANGVVDLPVDQDMRNLPNLTTATENKITSTFEALYGSLDRYDHVLYCLPAQTGLPWLAYTYPQSYQSYYNDRWCGYLSTPFHEVGHNLGLMHSGRAGDEEYGDKTCLMGDSYPREQRPRMCFNGHKFWVLGWFADKQQTVNPLMEGSWTGHVVAFVDVGKIDSHNPTEVVVLNVGDLYIVNNRAKDYNYGTQGNRNMMTIVKAGAPDQTSRLVTAMDERLDRNTYTTDLELSGFDQLAVTIEVCHRQRRDTVDFYVVSVRLAGEASTCIPPTPYPTTPSPTTSLTPTVSQQPTSAPPVTPPPSTLAPSAHPTTQQPTSTPSLKASSGPSASVRTQQPSSPPSSTPSTPQPTTPLPTTHQPLTTQPFTLPPVTLQPVTTRPSRSITPIPTRTTPEPTTRQTTTFQPVTKAPASVPPATEPSTLQPTSLQPTNEAPVSSPQTNQPTTFTTTSQPAVGPSATTSRPSTVPPQPPRPPPTRIDEAPPLVPSRVNCRNLGSTCQTHSDCCSSLCFGPRNNSYCVVARGRAEWKKAQKLGGTD